ncbi:hypothetical protein F-LCD7_0103 [Faustovirus]|nr:hypothetical protein F-LCD7_0103 [Faustovirus]
MYNTPITMATIPLEICEQLIEYAGPIAAGKLAQTCRELRGMYGIKSFSKSTYDRDDIKATVIRFINCKYIYYIDIPDHIIFVEHRANMSADRRITVISKETSRTLHARMLFAYGRWESRATDLLYHHINSGLLEDPQHYEVFFHYTIDRMVTTVKLIMGQLENDIIDVSITAIPQNKSV